MVQAIGICVVCVAFIDRILVLRLDLFPGERLAFLETVDCLLVYSVLHEGYLFIFLKKLQWFSQRNLLLTLRLHCVFVYTGGFFFIFRPEKPSRRSLLPSLIKNASL